MNDHGDRWSRPRAPRGHLPSRFERRWLGEVAGSPRSTLRGIVRHARSGYRRLLADRVDDVLALLDPDDFQDVFRRVWPFLQWDHRPTARRLYLLAKEGPGDGATVEIGSYLGNSTIYLAAGNLAGWRGVVHAVDAHTEDSMVQVLLPGETVDEDVSVQFLRNLEAFGVQDWVVYHRELSAKAAAEWGAGPVRLLFIDALHTYKAVMEDFLAWSPHLSRDYAVVFDDFLWPEVERAVRDLRTSFRPVWFAVRGGQAIFSSRRLNLRLAGFP